MIDLERFGIRPDWLPPIDLRENRYYSRIWTVVGEGGEDALCALFKNDNGVWEFRIRFRRGNQKATTRAFLRKIAEEKEAIAAAFSIMKLAAGNDFKILELVIESDDVAHIQELIEESGWFGPAKKVRAATLQ